MVRVGSVLSRPALGLAIIGGFLLPAAPGLDLSKYREFQLGADLPTIAKQTGANPATATVIHSRPALIQTLSWRPQPLGPSPKAEAAQEVVFSFYAGTLSRIEVNYDRYETEGLTAGDMIEAISAGYGTAVKSFVRMKAATDQQESLARWEDPQHRFELVRVSYGSAYRLTGVLKSLEAPVQAAEADARRLDEQEAPQREAARAASEQDAAKAKLETARLANKAKFRP